MLGAIGLGFRFWGSEESLRGGPRDRGKKGKALTVTSSMFQLAPRLLWGRSRELGGPATPREEWEGETKEGTEPASILVTWPWRGAYACVSSWHAPEEGLHPLTTPTPPPRG